MKTVRSSELQTIRMTAGNEKKYPTVIDDGVVKDWVAIGWIDMREATKEDYEKFPVVVR
jgi:hypothetical protein